MGDVHLLDALRSSYIQEEAKRTEKLDSYWASSLALRTPQKQPNCNPPANIGPYKEAACHHASVHACKLAYVGTVAQSSFDQRLTQRPAVS